MELERRGGEGRGKGGEGRGREERGEEGRVSKMKGITADTRILTVICFIVCTTQKATSVKFYW